MKMYRCLKKAKQPREVILRVRRSFHFTCLDSYNYLGHVLLHDIFGISAMRPVP